MQHFRGAPRYFERARNLPPRVSAGEFTPGQFRVAAGQPLFKPGEMRRVYRVVRGAISHIDRSADGQWQVIEFGFPGDLLGLGYLATHCTTATALVDTTVSIVSERELEAALGLSERLRFRLADAGEREFDYVRANAVSVSLHTPLQRLAYYLLAISGINGAEGRDATLIAEDVTSGNVASGLHMTIDALAMALLILKRDGVLDASEKGLQIIDIARLEAIASAGAGTAPKS